ncbi:GNAT family N-acetyltransferase [Acidobacteriota bacterium]
MEKKVTIKTGTSLAIRELTYDDLDGLIEFYSNLPLNDRLYLRIDVTDRELVKQRIEDAVNKKDIRLIALKDDRIIGSGALEFPREGWKKNQGELRIIVARDYQRKGVGLSMSRELYQQALENKVEKLVVKIMKPQTGPRRMLRKLGFRKESVITDYVTDQSDHTQDLLIMSCEMKDFWKELSMIYGDSDWQRCR